MFYQNPSFSQTGILPESLVLPDRYFTRTPRSPRPVFYQNPSFSQTGILPESLILLDRYFATDFHSPRPLFCHNPLFFPDRYFCTNSQFPRLVFCHNSSLFQTGAFARTPIFRHRYFLSQSVIPLDWYCAVSTKGKRVDVSRAQNALWLGGSGSVGSDPLPLISLALFTSQSYFGRTGRGTVATDQYLFAAKVCPGKGRDERRGGGGWYNGCDTCCTPVPCNDCVVLPTPPLAACLNLTVVVGVLSETYCGVSF